MTEPNPAVLCAGVDLGARRLSIAVIALDPDNDRLVTPIIRNGIIDEDEDQAVELQNLGRLARQLLRGLDVAMTCVERPAGHGISTMSAAFGAVCASVPSSSTCVSLYPSQIRSTLGLPQSGKHIVAEGSSRAAWTKAHKAALRQEARSWIVRQGHAAPLLTHDDADAIHAARAARIREWNRAWEQAA